MAVAALKIENDTFSNLAYLKLKEAILSGLIHPGTSLVERELVAAMNVSRTPIRAACQRLVTEGLVNSSPHKGMSVKVLTRDEAQAAYEVRAALEGLSSRLATERATDEELQKLRANYISTARTDDWFSNTQFLKRQKLHHEIACLSRNADLAEKLAYTINRISLWRNNARNQGITFRITDEEHDEILSLMLERKAPEARLRMEEHIERSWRNSIKSI